jgi:hypothetical protein
MLVIALVGVAETNEDTVANNQLLPPDTCQQLRVGTLCADGHTGAAPRRFVLLGNRSSAPDITAVLGGKSRPVE